MKILIPVLCFGKAGGYRTLSYMATEWKELGHEVEFVASEATELPYYPTKANIIYITLKGKICKRTPQKQINFKNMFYALVDFLKRHSTSYDAVIANHNITAVAVKKGSKTNNYYYVQAYEPEMYKCNSLHNAIKKIIAYRTYHYPMVKIVNADIYKNYKNLKSDYVIPPGLDLEIYYPKKTRWDRISAIKVGCIGRIESWKGSQDVADAIEILKKQGVNIKFIVAFHPVKCSDYQLVKPDGDSNLSNYYRNLDILVAPGKIQLGAVHYPVIEAMACGISVITTGYYPADKCNSYLVPVSNPQAIAKAILQIIDNYDEAEIKIKNALKEVERFDWKRVSKDFVEVINKTRRIP